MHFDIVLLSENPSGYACAHRAQCHSEDGEWQRRLVPGQVNDQCAHCLLLHRMRLQCLVYVRDIGELMQRNWHLLLRVHKLVAEFGRLEEAKAIAELRKLIEIN